MTMTLMGMEEPGKKKDGGFVYVKDRSDVALEEGLSMV